MSSIEKQPVQQPNVCPPSYGIATCVAQFEFNAEHPEDLEFRKGDSIIITEYINTEWARGELNGKSGIFPLSFVVVQESNGVMKVPARSNLVETKLQESAPASHSAIAPSKPSQSTHLKNTAMTAGASGFGWAVGGRLAARMF